MLRKVQGIPLTSLEDLQVCSEFAGACWIRHAAFIHREDLEGKNMQRGWELLWSVFCPSYVRDKYLSVNE